MISSFTGVDNPANQAFASWFYNEEIERQKTIMLARQYHDGVQETFLNERLRQFLNARSNHEFNLNICRTVVDVIVERLILDGVGTDETTPKPVGKPPATINGQGDPVGQPVDSTQPQSDYIVPDLPKPVESWSSRVWRDVNGPIIQDAVHEGAIRDGEYFIIVDWDMVQGRPVFLPHHRYVDSAYDGDGFGCKAHYPDDDPGANQPMLYASKRWVDYSDPRNAVRRMNLYYPDRIEKYHWAGDWVEHKDEGDASWPLPWVDSAGQPLGVPVVHFQNTGDLRPEAWDAIPMQRAINKSMIDLLATGDMAAFQILVALGWIPTTDGEPLKADKSNAITFGPGQIIGTSRTKAEADFLSIPGADLTPAIEVINSLLGWVAVITSTPASRTSFSRQIASEGTLKEQKEGLFAKIRKRQKHLDRAWRECFNMARRLENAFGAGGLPEEPNFVMQWEPIQARDTADERDEWSVKKSLGIPTEQIWKEMGYSPEEIAMMLQSTEYQSRIAMMQVGIAAANQGA